MLTDQLEKKCKVLRLTEEENEQLIYRYVKNILSLNHSIQRSWTT